jgi:hypothetical protein
MLLSRFGGCEGFAADDSTDVDGDSKICVPQVVAIGNDPSQVLGDLVAQNMQPEHVLSIHQSEARLGKRHDLLSE